MSDTATAVADSLEKHSIIVAGADASQFPGEEVKNLRDPRVRQMTKHDIRPGFTIPPGTKKLIFCSPGLTRETVATLKAAAANNPNVQVFEVHHQNALRENLKNALRFTPPIGSPAGPAAPPPPQLPSSAPPETPKSAAPAPPPPASQAECAASCR